MPSARPRVRPDLEAQELTERPPPGARPVLRLAGGSMPPNRAAPRRPPGLVREVHTEVGGLMVGQSAAMERLWHQIARVAPTAGAVLVQGETGVGKELAARALHQHSPRARQALVALNCAALPPGLLEAELFGSAPGAFTGARVRPGLLRTAHRGTLFLDEVGDLALPAQASLLRVLETGTLRPLGCDEVVVVDVRLICATHRDLKAAVAAGQFRADLYHRISTFVVGVPALRERLDDLGALARAVAGPEVQRLTPGAWRALRAHPWPGNVRELRNVLQRAVALYEGPIEAEQLELEVPMPTAPGLGTLRARVVALVRDEVARQGGNLRAAARVLGVSPTTLYRYLATA